jgi:hypothetical protein
VTSAVKVLRGTNQDRLCVNSACSSALGRPARPCPMGKAARSYAGRVVSKWSLALPSAAAGLTGIRSVGSAPYQRSLRTTTTSPRRRRPTCLTAPRIRTHGTSMRNADAADDPDQGKLVHFPIQLPPVYDLSGILNLSDFPKSVLPVFPDLSNV